jgi:hypothetical protein
MTPFVANTTWPPILRDQGPIGRPARQADASFDESTTCSQSQIGRNRHLRNQGTAHVEVDVALSVSVRSGPVGTATRGTVVVRRREVPWHTVKASAPTSAGGGARPR